MDTTPNYGLVIPSADDTDLMDADLWRTPFTQVDTKLKALTDADTAASGRLNTLETYGRGEIAYSQIVASTALNVQGVMTDVPGLSVVLPVQTVARKYKLSAGGIIAGSVANDRFVVFLLEGATTLKTYQSAQLVTAGSGYSFEFSVRLTPTLPTHTYKLAIQRLAGTGNIDISAAASTPAFLLLEDIGKV